jgi:predicted amidophosphoribosyltransferase
MLILCPECNKQISDKVKMCINCGFPIEESKEEKHDLQSIVRNIKKEKGLPDDYFVDKKDLVFKKYIIMALKKLYDMPGSESFPIAQNYLNNNSYNIALDKNHTNSSLTPCPTCHSNISKTAETCPHCGEKLAKRCPKCNSTNITRINGVSKGVSASLFGVFSANTVLNDFQCNKCGTKFK